MGGVAAAVAADGGLSVSLPAPSPPSPAASFGHSPSSSLCSSSLLSSVAGCLSEWRLVGLDGLRSSLDRSALSLSDEEDRASAARSSLSAQSKALKRAGPDEKLSQLGGVVKAYQEEINALTRRAKAAETAFLSLYQLLIKAQDPSHALQQALAALQQAAGLEAELARSRQHVDELDRELSTLKNQDATLRRLEAQLRDVDKRTEQRVREAIAEHDEASRQRAAQERWEAAETEAGLQHALDECRQSLAQQAAAHQQQQNAHFKESEKHEKAARDAEKELDSLRADNERLLHSLQAAVSSQRAAEEREGREGGQSLSVSGSRQSSPGSEPSSELEAELQSLRDALSAVQLDSAESQDVLRAERAEREAERRAAAESVERLTLQLAQWKHKALTSSGSGSGPQPKESGAHTEGQTGAERLEEQTAAHDALLAEVAAGRALSEQLSRRMDEQQTEAHSRLQQLSSAVEEAERSSMQQQRLIAQLEADISLLQQQQPQHANTAAKHSTSVPFEPLSSIATSASSDGSRTAASVPSRSTVDASATVEPSEPAPLPSSAPCCSCSSLLRIVSGQRDRLRVRVEQLEREVGDRQSALLEARAAKQQLQDDNVALYEKLTYVTSFEQQQQQHSHSHFHSQSQSSRQTGRGASHQSSSSPSSIDTLSAVGGSNGGSAMSERRYAKLYAESLNPFSAWKSGQLLANERSLPPSERVTLTCARLLFSRRAARSFAFFYALVLHLLVFAVLWTHTVTDHCASHVEEDT